MTEIKEYEVSTWIPNRSERREYLRNNPNASAAETIMAKSIAETDTSGTKKLVWYEISTNIPKEVKTLTFKCEVTDIGIKLTIGQDGDLIPFQNFGKNRAKGKESEDIFKVAGQSDVESCFFGTGTGYISSKVRNYLIHVLGKDGVWETEVRETGQQYELPNDVEEDWTLPVEYGIFDQSILDSWKRNNYKVVQTMLIRNSHYFTNMNIIEELNKVLGITFGTIIESDGIKITIDDEEVEPILTHWFDKDKNGKPKPTWTTLYDAKKNEIRVVSVTHPTNRGRNAQCDFKITAVGKRTQGQKEIMYLIDEYDKDGIGDRPVLILRLPDGKFIGVIFLRARSGDEHLNRVVVEATVAREDIIQYFGKLSKGEGWVNGFETAVAKKFRAELEKYCYIPDDSLEECKQLHVYNVIVFDMYGDSEDIDSANDHRNSLGLGFLNNMKPETRKNYVDKEYKDGINRYDINVRVPKNTEIELDGVIRTFNEDVYVIIENKKVKWQDKDCKQSAFYGSSKKSCVYVYGMSIEITDDMKTNYSTHFNHLQKGEQFRLGTIGGKLIDLKKGHWRWTSVEDYYRTLLAETQDNSDE
jgi:hypothetical protein